MPFPCLRHPCIRCWRPFLEVVQSLGRSIDWSARSNVGVSFSRPLTLSLATRRTRVSFGAAGHLHVRRPLHPRGLLRSQGNDRAGRSAVVRVLSPTWMPYPMLPGGEVFPCLSRAVTVTCISRCLVWVEGVLHLPLSTPPLPDPTSVLSCAWSGSCWPL